VICIGAIGFGVCLMFLFLYAPDIAITQIVVEVLGLIILIRATIARDLTFITGDREFFGVVVSVVIVFVIFLAGVKVFETLPDFGTPIFAQVPGAASQTYVAKGLKDTGAANVVASVILDYRAYDTLGEATVLFTSIIGATVILRDKARKLLQE
jgi:multisubunit Na+/H+ antiporter MnhB subunit